MSVRALGLLRACLCYAFLAGLTALLLTRAAVAPPMVHDSFWIDVNWSQQFTSLLQSGNPYPRWLPQSFGGLGSPTFYYYAPLSFLLAGLFGLAGLPAYSAVLAAFAAAWLGSGVTMYLWLRPRAHAPILGASLYMVLPYHVMDFYGRGALAEFCAYAIIPVIAIGLHAAIERGRAGLLSCAYAILIMTHLPTALLMSVLMIAPLALWSVRQQPRKLWPVVYGTFHGLALAAIYLIPALALQKHSSVAALWAVPFLQPISWSLLHPELWTSKSYVLLFAGLALAVATAVVIVSGRRWTMWAVWTAGLCFIVAGLLPGFWSLPVVKAVQFPWRGLLLAEFGLATIVATTPRSPALLALACVPLVAFALLMARPDNPMNGEPMQRLPTPGLQDVIEYLPRGLVGPDRSPLTGRIEQAVSVARLHPGSVFPFPSLVGRCGDKELPLAQERGGAILLIPPPHCRVVVKRLGVEYAGFLISLIGCLSLLLPWLTKAGSFHRTMKRPLA